MSQLDDSLNAYLDGALTTKAAQALERRLAEPAVARRLASLRALRRGLAESRPQLSPADSRRLWVGIRARVVAEPAGAAEPSLWERLFARRWAPAWGLTLVGTAAALWLLLLQPAAPRLDAPAIPAVADAVPAPAAVAPAAARAFVAHADARAAEQ